MLTFYLFENGHRVSTYEIARHLKISHADLLSKIHSINSFENIGLKTSRSNGYLLSTDNILKLMDFWDDENKRRLDSLIIRLSQHTS